MIWTPLVDSLVEMYQSGRTNSELCIGGTCADPENFLRRVGGGGPNSQKGSDGKFHHRKN